MRMLDTRSPRGSSILAIDRIQKELQPFIGSFFQNHPKYPRYVDLKRDQIFASLVNLYSQIFTTHWTHFRRFLETFELPAAYHNNPRGYAAAVYVTAWFHDLYVSNRLACRKLSLSAYNEHYFMDIVHKSLEYDVFLACLNSQIRPTNIKGNHEDTLFIPRIQSQLNVNSHDENYFNIAGWAMNETCLHGILSILKDRKIFKLEPLLDNTLGRPSWLFDWQEDNLAYAWFHSDNNYTMEDVAFAYIIGEACTPRLAPRDFDEWQNFPRNIVPAELNYAAYNRVRALTYHGAVEYRTIETRRYQYPPGMILVIPQSGRTATTGPSTRQLTVATTQSQKKKAQQTTGGIVIRRQKAKLGERGNQTSVIHGSEEAHQVEEGEEVVRTQLAEPTPTPGEQAQTQATASTAAQTLTIPPINQFRIVDYLYHARVVVNIDVHTRISALRQFFY